MNQKQDENELMHIKGRYHSDKIEYGDFVMITNGYSACEEKGTIHEKLLYELHFIVIEIDGDFQSVDKFYDGSQNAQKIRSRISNNMKVYDRISGISIFTSSNSVKVIKKNNFFSRSISYMIRRKSKYVNKYKLGK